MIKKGKKQKRHEIVANRNNNVILEKIEHIPEIISPILINITSNHNLVEHEIEANRNNNIIVEKIGQMAETTSPILVNVTLNNNLSETVPKTFNQLLNMNQKNEEFFGSLDERSNNYLMNMIYQAQVSKNMMNMADIIRVHRYQNLILNNKLNMIKMSLMNSEHNQIQNEPNLDSNSELFLPTMNKKKKNDKNK